MRLFLILIQTLVTQIALNCFVGAAARNMDFCRPNADRLGLIITGCLCGDSRVDTTFIQRNIERLVIDR